MLPKTAQQEVISKCIYEIEQRQDVKGIYCISGEKCKTDFLYLSLMRGPQVIDLSKEEIDVHDIACVLKRYIRQLSDPVVPYILYEGFLLLAMKDLSQNGDPNTLSLMRSLLNTLPTPHYITLKLIIEHLARVSTNEERYGISASAKTLAIIFAPDILRSRNEYDSDLTNAAHDIKYQITCLCQMIQNAQILFADASILCK